MESNRAGPPPPGWTRVVFGRIWTWWWAKLIGTSAGMAVFFFAYFWLLRHPHGPITVMPLTAVDRLVTFQQWALPLYLSLWLYVSLAPALVLNRRELVSYGVAATALSAAALGVFFVWPTAVPAAEIDWSRHPALAFLKEADAAGNACPSLHVAFAVFTAFWFERLLRDMGAGRAWRGLNVLWCAAILYSTLAVRQHVFLDGVAGAALGAMTAAAHFAWLRRARETNTSVVSR